MRLTAVAHEQLSRVIEPGDIVVDATIGNGYDTKFLAESVGPNGHVFGFDIQREALRQTYARLIRHQLQDRVTLVAAGHEHMCAQLPENLTNTIAAVTFNLGYLPGGDKQLTTQSDSTVNALTQSLILIRPNGVISLLAYVGHRRGSGELGAVRNWLRTLSAKKVRITEWSASAARAPVLLLLRKSASG